jgi:ectoine hydroxylase-related dioxygenase (phytanoyl-CoA dioxygenase family)
MDNQPAARSQSKRLQAEPAAPGADAILGALERDGWAVADDLLDAATLARARAEVGALLAATPFGRDDFEGRRTRRVYALFAKTRALDAAAIHPLALAVLDRVLGPAAQLSAPAAIEIGPGERAQPLHRDDLLYPVGERRGELVLSVMWPLVDFDDANGGTRIVPRSHGAPRGPAPAVERAISVDVRAGSALFYVGSLWHGGGANRTAAPRTGVVMNYAAGWLRPAENQALAVPPARAAALPRRLQELLGYGIHPPFLGYVDGRHPARLLDAGATT